MTWLLWDGLAILMFAAIVLAYRLGRYAGWRAARSVYLLEQLLAEVARSKK